MFKHQHPYPPFIPEGTKRLIVGTLPPPRFTTGDLKIDDVNFCYGSRDGQLWKILEAIYGVSLLYDNSEEAIIQRKQLLEQHNIGICDMVECAFRKEINAADLGIQNPVLRPIIPILKEHPSVEMLLFTGGNSKNGPEYFFRSYLKNYPKIEYVCVNDNVPRIHQFKLESRVITTVSLTAPSGAANRAVGSMSLYKKLKKDTPKLNTLDFRIKQYTPFFLSE